MTSEESLRFELFSRDILATAAFLERVLGFSTIRAEVTYFELQLGSVAIGLSPIHVLPQGHPLKAAGGERLGLGVEIVIETEDVEAAHERARTHGQHSLTPLAARPWGLRDFRVTSPDGYYFRVTSR
jgi:predicted enzyme related to lactoylglutathione lyase